MERWVLGGWGRDYELGNANASKGKQENLGGE